MKISGVNFDDNKPVKKPVYDDTQAQSSSTTVPMVEEKADNDFLVPDIDTGNKPTISDSTNPLSETYRDLQSLRAKAKGDGFNDKKGEELLKSVVKLLEVWTKSAQDDENYDALNFSVRKGLHGDGSTENTYEHDTGGDAFRTNNNATITYGTKTSNTTASFAFDIGINKDNENSPAIEGFDKIRYNDYQDQVKERAENGQPSDEIPIPVPAHNRDIDQHKNIDGEIKHNRTVTYKGKQYNLAAGGDFHFTDASTMFTIRGAVQNEDGIRLSYDTTRTISDNGKRTIDNRFRIRLIDNEEKNVLVSKTEEETEDFEANNESETSQYPFEIVDVRTEDKFGIELVIDDSDFGAKASYIVFDNGKLDKLNNYKRTRFYLNAGLVDGTSNDHNNFKLTNSVNYIYERAYSNGYYTQAKADVGFNSTIAHGERPDHVVFGNLTVDAKRGHSKYDGGLHYVTTKNINLGWAGVGYTYEADKWSAGANIDYVRGTMFREKVDYLSLGLKAAYHF